MDATTEQFSMRVNVAKTKVMSVGKGESRLPGPGIGCLCPALGCVAEQTFGAGAKVQVFNTFVVLHFVYGVETWNVTQSQQQRLKSAYNSCLRGIMGRMPKAKYPHVALTVQLTGATFGRGKLRQSFRSIVYKDLKAAGIPHQGGECMCRQGTNHFGASWCRACRLHMRPPHRHAYSRPGHANTKGAAICGLARVFGWHHLVLPGSHSAHRQNQ
ncbi:unnamed protein product [Sphagnum balticum]